MAATRTIYLRKTTWIRDRIGKYLLLADEFAHFNEVVKARENSYGL